MNKLFYKRKLGFYLSFAAGILAAVGAVAYVAVYLLTASGEPDRVFEWLTFGMILAGGLVGIVTELYRLRFGPLLATALTCVGLAYHLVESAYPLADVLTGVPFFGGDFTLALIFAIVFGAAALVQVAAAFMEHNEELN